MERVTLYDGSNGHISTCIWAYLRDGSLVLEGQDLGMGGGSVESVWGSSEYEYFHSLSPEDTQKLEIILREETHLDREFLFLVGRFFAGKNACANFRSFCEKHGLVVKFFSC